MSHSTPPPEHPQSPELVILSPHRDDAAFSCGVLLHTALRTCSVRIVNIFTQSSYAPFDPAVESQGTEAVTVLRAAEDHAFLNLMQSSLGSNCSLSMADLAQFDAPLRPNLPSDVRLSQWQETAPYEDEVSRLATLLKPHLQNARCVLLPLALGGRGLEGHIDHRITREAGRRSAPNPVLAFYEDLPYAARMLPPVRDAAVAAFAGACGVTPYPLHQPQCGTIKLHCTQCYPSQVDLSTMQQMSVYTQQRGGEQLYAASEAHAFLQLLQDSLEPR